MLSFKNPEFNDTAAGPTTQFRVVAMLPLKVVNHGELSFRCNRSFIMNDTEVRSWVRNGRADRQVANRVPKDEQ